MIDKNKKGFYVFSDPGGAKPILSFLSLFSPNQYIVVSDRNFDFYNLFNIDVIVIKRININLLNDFKPDYIFTGTSYRSQIELQHLSYAKRKNISTFSYVDHYSKIKERFKFNNRFIYPDNILFIDNKAKKLAKNLNLDKFSKLHIFQNYYIKFLNNWKPKLNKNDLYEKFNVNKKNKIILYAPDPLSNLNWKEKYGFDETHLWNILSDIINTNFNNITVAIKLHPNQNIKYLKNTIKTNPISSIIFVNEEYLLDMFCISEIIVGIFSSILIEANIFNDKIIRYVPNQVEDFLKLKDIGVLCSEKKQLKKQLKNYLCQ